MSEKNVNYSEVPLTPLRKIISARMVEAKQTIPHFRVSADIEMDALLAFRRQLNSDNPGQTVSVNDFIIRACAMTLMEWPVINSQFEDKKCLQYSQADISVVMAVEGGLATPILRNADKKNVGTIAGEVKQLSARALAGQLKMEEILGGSFSISNLGMYGVDQFDAIINPPQVAILAVAAAKPQVLVRDGELVAGTVMRVSLSLDHRAVDGVDGAGFLADLRDLLQQPERLGI